MGDHKSGSSQQNQGQISGQGPSPANPGFNFGSINPGWGFNTAQATAAAAPEQPAQPNQTGQWQAPAQAPLGMGQAPMMNPEVMAQAWQQMQAMQQQMAAMQQQMAFMSQAQAYAQTQAPGQSHPSGHDQGQAQRQGQGQSQGMAQFMQEISSGGTGLNSLTKMLDFDDKDFWKGALVGAAVIMLFTNESLQNMLFKGAVKSRDAVKDGVEKVKTKVKSSSKTKAASNESSTSASEQ
jgi:hypothetical protein